MPSSTALTGSTSWPLRKALVMSAGALMSAEGRLHIMSGQRRVVERLRAGIERVPHVDRAACRIDEKRQRKPHVGTKTKGGVGNQGGM